ncbi:MAG: DNA internalization-related competence protein ComEC/Rec2 [Lachnospiraceae bacterium]|nr:DNA internalization-related competence protein ComEC/Rec2 [Lachnospiraceae bacterium]
MKELLRRRLCFFGILFLAAVWTELMLAGPPEDTYDLYSGERVIVTGKVSRKEIKTNSYAVYLSDVHIAEGSGDAGAGSEKNRSYKDLCDGARSVDLGLVCYLSTDGRTDADLPYMGAWVRVEGKISEFRRATNPGQFDMKNYYLYKGYGANMYIDTWEEVSESYSFYREWLWRLRCFFGSVYDLIMDPDDAGVMRAMILGDKSELSDDIKELYRMNGIAHILAISGLHISIIGFGLYKLLRRTTMPVTPSVCVSALVLLSYAEMTGQGTSTVRAVTMFIIMTGADILRRSYDLPTALVVSALTCIITSPYELMTSGFWMSYMAVGGAAVFYPAVKQKIRIENRHLKTVLSALGSGVCVTVFTMPLIALSYYEIPVYSVLLNLAVIPLMTVLMVMGVLSLAAGCISADAGCIMAIPCHLVMSLYSFLCEAIEQLPFHNYICGAPVAWQVAVFYGIIILVIAYGKKMKLYERILAMPVALAVLFCRLSSGFFVTMLDVGQGDGICVSSEETVCMIDGGSSSKKDLFKYTIMPFLKYKGYSRVDCWFISHPDSDHTSGLIEMLQTEDMGSIDIGRIILPDAYGACGDFEELISLADSHNVEVVYFSTGDCLTDESGLRIFCMHPDEGYRTDDVNSYSEILEVTYGTFGGIFTGDATVESEQNVLGLLTDEEMKKKLKFPEGGYQVLKVGHHGSRTSSSEEWLSWVSPSVALISAGDNNSYGHPHEDVLERLGQHGVDVFRTDESGAIMIREHKDGIEISCFCD